MAGQRKTSPKVAKVASSLLRSRRTSKPTRTVAASTLSQRAPLRKARGKK